MNKAPSEPKTKVSGLTFVYVPNKKDWLIWSIEHNGWWGNNSRGYVEDINKAGRYSFKEAVDILHDANIGLRHEKDTPNEAMIHESVLEGHNPFKK